MQSYITVKRNRINLITFYSLTVSCLFLLFNLHETSALFYAGLVGLVFSLFIFSEKEMFLLISFLIPNLFMFKQIGSDSAILGYFFVLLSIKECIKNIRPKIKVNVFFLAHILFAIITCTIYSDRSLLLSLIRFSFNFSLFVHYASMLSRDGEIKQVVKMYFAGVIVAVIMGIIYRSSKGTLYNGYFGGVNCGRNYFGAVITPAITCAVLYFLEKEVSFTETVLYGATIASCLVSIVLSASRTSVLCLAILALMCIMNLVNSSLKFNKKMIPLVFILAILVFLVYVNYKDSIMYLITRFGEDDMNTGNGRFDLWQYYAKQVFESPITFLFGNGTVYESTVEQVEHNTIVQCFYQLGVMGLLTLFGFIRQTFRKVNKGKKIRFITVFPLLSVIVPYCGINALYSDQLSFLLIMCAIIMRDFS